MNVGGPMLSMTPRHLAGEAAEEKKQVESGSGQDLTWSDGSEIEWSANND